MALASHDCLVEGQLGDQLALGVGELDDAVVEAVDRDVPVVVVQAREQPRQLGQRVAHAPPNEPEWMSPAGPCRSSWPSVMPRMPVQIVGVSRDHMPVSRHDDDVAGEPVAPLREQGGEVRRAGLLLALDDQLEVDGGAGAAGRREVGADAERVEEDLALVVGRAARVQPLAVDASARTAGAPTARAA